MSERFADAVPRLCALSARGLGWLPGQFWKATPGELAMALADPDRSSADTGIARDELEQMMEQDSDG